MRCLRHRARHRLPPCGRPRRVRDWAAPKLWPLFSCARFWIEYFKMKPSTVNITASRSWWDLCNKWVRKYILISPSAKRTVIMVPPEMRRYSRWISSLACYLYLLMWTSFLIFFHSAIRICWKCQVRSWTRERWPYYLSNFEHNSWTLLFRICGTNVLGENQKFYVSADLWFRVCFGPTNRRKWKGWLAATSRNPIFLFGKVVNWWINVSISLEYMKQRWNSHWKQYSIQTEQVYRSMVTRRLSVWTYENDHAPWGIGRW